MSCSCNCSHPRTYGGLGCGTACLTFPILPDNPFIPLPECPDAPCCNECMGCCQQRCCATGPTGPTGPRGATGATGATGPAGTAASAFASFYQTGVLGNTFDDRALELESGNCTEGIDTDGKNVMLYHAGAYHIIYSINVPASTSLSTDFYLEVNGEILPGTVVHLENDGLCGSTHLTAHHTITTNDNTSLRLLSNRQFSFHATNDDDVLASLTIMRIR